VIRAGDLARLSQQEIQFLDAITRKLAPGAPQNQKESKPAIEVVGLELASEQRTEEDNFKDYAHNLGSRPVSLA
jgi:hypothetical protein